MGSRFGEAGRRLSYGTYLKVPELLGLQQGLSHEHDELLFIVAHQVYELWFKVVLFELEAARDRVDADDIFFARHYLKRVHVIERLLVERSKSSRRCHLRTSSLFARSWRRLADFSRCSFARSSSCLG